MQYMERVVETQYSSNSNAEIKGLVSRGVLEGFGLFLRKFDQNDFELVERVAAEHGPATIKIHLAPSPYLISQINMGKARVFCSYRDPRDVVLSIIDHARRENQTRDGLEYITSVRTALPFARWASEVAISWKNSGSATMLRYDDIILSPQKVISALGEAIGVELDAESTQSIIASELSSRKKGANQYNTGRLQRYHDEMTKDDLHLCIRKLSDCIQLLGFELDEK